MKLNNSLQFNPIRRNIFQRILITVRTRKLGNRKTTLRKQRFSCNSINDLLSKNGLFTLHKC